MICPHFDNGRCRLAELLALKVLGTDLQCGVSEDQCQKCLSSGEPSEEKPSMQVTAAVTRARGQEHKKTWASFASSTHLPRPERPKIQQPTPAVKTETVAHTGKRVRPSRPGPGTILARILKGDYNAKEGAECPCNSRMVMMDTKGLAWCEANIEMITGWLVEEVDRRNLKESYLPEKIKRWGCRRIVRRAIKEAKDWTSPIALDS